MKCQLWRGDTIMGEAIGECNSWESKYRWREGGRKCPQCQAAAIIKTKKNQYWCAPFKGGCSAGYPLNDPAITGQQTGRVPNPDIFDQVNTFVKMAQKRAHVAATINATSASELFSQDPEAVGGSDPDAEPMVEGTQHIDAGQRKPEQPKAEPDDETMLGYLKRIEADPKEAATIAAILLDDIENLMGKDMADRTWEAFTRQSGNPPTVEANKKAYWTIAVRALHGNLKELKERAAKQNKA
jgi:hypothetical protein